MKKFKYIKVDRSYSLCTEDEIIRYCDLNEVELISIFDDHFLVKEELVEVLDDYVTVGYDIKNKDFLSHSSILKYLMAGYKFLTITNESLTQNCANCYEAHLAKYKYIDKKEYDKILFGVDDNSNKKINTISTKKTELKDTCVPEFEKYISAFKNESSYFKIGETYGDCIFLPNGGYDLGQMTEHDANANIGRLRIDVGREYKKVYAPFCVVVNKNGKINRVIKTDENYCWVVKKTNDKVYVNKNSIKKT